MADTKTALKNNRVVLALTKHKKENKFLIYMNLAIGGSRCIKKNKKMLKWQPFEEGEASWFESETGFALKSGHFFK